MLDQLYRTFISAQNVPLEGMNFRLPLLVPVYKWWLPDYNQCCFDREFVLRAFLAIENKNPEMKRHFFAL